jgi:hypothetical protein
VGRCFEPAECRTAEVAHHPDRQGEEEGGCQGESDPTEEQRHAALVVPGAQYPPQTLHGPCDGLIQCFAAERIQILAHKPEDRTRAHAQQYSLDVAQLGVVRLDLVQQGALRNGLDPLGGGLSPILGAEVAIRGAKHRDRSVPYHECGWFPGLGVSCLGRRRAFLGARLGKRGLERGKQPYQAQHGPGQ